MKTKNPLSLTPSQRRWTRKLCDALESGEYKQCRNQLRKGNSFCCLGVACDLVDKKAWGKDDDGYATHRGQQGTPTNTVADKFGFDGEGGFELDIDGELDCMIGHNDDQQKRFPTIAKAIRQQVLGEEV